jgi:hypothetical protein
MVGADVVFRVAAAICSVVVAAMLPSCSRAELDTQRADDKTALHARYLREAMHPSYRSTEGLRTECVGRQLVDFQPNMRWGITRADRGSGAGVLENGQFFGFSENVRDVSFISIDGVSVRIADAATRKDFEHARNTLASQAENATRGTKADLVRAQEALQFNQERTGIPPDEHVKVLARSQKEIDEVREELAHIARTFRPVDLGMPDSYAYQQGEGEAPTLKAVLLRGDRMFIFVSYGFDNVNVRRETFMRVVKNFRERKPFEIPAERGVCVPWGFVADDGTVPSRIVLGVRYADVDAVTYTLNIGTAGHGQRPEVPLVQAGSIAAVGVLGGLSNEQAAGKVTQRFGPRSAAIGGQKGTQAGIELNLADAGQPPVWSYAVYTGIAGIEGSQLLGDFVVRVRSYSRKQLTPTGRDRLRADDGTIIEPPNPAKEISADPPPLKDTMLRLDAMLQSVRLRPTTPAMPEVADLAKLPAK